MTALIIHHSQGSYPIYFASPVFAQVQKHVGQRALVITDENIASFYLEPLRDALKDTELDYYVLPSGESEKNFSNYQRLLDYLIEKQHHRDTTLIALGGGVISDLTGFVAATFLRGVSYITIPTTLLAQVDASIGGKTAINHPMGKNLIGAFYPPKAVLMDIQTLQTLPDREYRSGFAEIIKAALIHDAAFFEWLENNADDLMARDEKKCLYAVRRSCEIKQYFVENDEKEISIRKILNLGHTFGHALESHFNYQVLHGEAVAMGLILAAYVSMQLTHFSEEAFNRITKLIKKFNLLQNFPSFDYQALIAHMQYDKKIKNNKLTLILLSDIGKPIIRNNISDSFLSNSPAPPISLLEFCIPNF